MDFMKAAIEVLGSEDRPMTGREITEIAIQRNLIQPHGKTPVATMTARLYVATRDDPECQVERLYKPGPTRAQRGSVRWRRKD
jgi:hypothetical protein